MSVRFVELLSEKVPLLHDSLTNNISTSILTSLNDL